MQIPVTPVNLDSKVSKHMVARTIELQVSDACDHGSLNQQEYKPRAVQPKQHLWREYEELCKQMDGQLLIQLLTLPPLSDELAWCLSAAAYTIVAGTDNGSTQACGELQTHRSADIFGTRTLFAGQSMPVKQAGRQAGRQTGRQQ